MEPSAVTPESWPHTVSEWLAEQLAGYAPPYAYSLVPAGGSNLTYIVTSGSGRRFVMRRPPLAARLATAHDMAREYRIMQALAGSPVPVPKMLAFCDDETICDVSFYCMEMVDGRVIRDHSSAADLNTEQCATATRSLVDAQVAFHTIDLQAIGLSDLAQHDAYLERQLRRWKKQVDKAAVRDVPAFNQLHQELSGNIPEQCAASGLAHGDYRFDNTILAEDLSIAAVLDWELCTIGDPVADFIWSLNYWAQPDDTLYWLQDPPTLNPNFPSRQQVMNWYQQASGINVEQHLSWYNAFSWWKQACIVEGVYARLLKGASGGMKVAAADQVAERVDRYLVQAGEYAASI